VADLVAVLCECPGRVRTNRTSGKNRRKTTHVALLVTATGNTLLRAFTGLVALLTTVVALHGGTLDLLVAGGCAEDGVSDRLSFTTDAATHVHSAAR
jgi:hypothetical protein